VRSESESEWGVSRGPVAEGVLSTGCLYACRRRLGALGSHLCKQKRTKDLQQSDLHYRGGWFLHFAALKAAVGVSSLGVLKAYIR